MRAVLRHLAAVVLSCLLAGAGRAADLEAEASSGELRGDRLTVRWRLTDVSSAGPELAVLFQNTSDKTVFVPWGVGSGIYCPGCAAPGIDRDSDLCAWYRHVAILASSASHEIPIGPRFWAGAVAPLALSPGDTCTADLRLMARVPQQKFHVTVPVVRQAEKTLPVAAVSRPETRSVEGHIGQAEGELLRVRWQLLSTSGLNPDVLLWLENVGAEPVALETAFEPRVCGSWVLRPTGGGLDEFRSLVRELPIREVVEAHGWTLYSLPAGMRFRILDRVLSFGDCYAEATVSARGAKGRAELFRIRVPITKEDLESGRRMRSGDR